MDFFWKSVHFSFMIWIYPRDIFKMVEQFFFSFYVLYYFLNLFISLEILLWHGISKRLMQKFRSGKMESMSTCTLTCIYLYDDDDIFCVTENQLFYFRIFWKNHRLHKKTVMWTVWIPQVSLKSVFCTRKNPRKYRIV